MIKCEIKHRMTRRLADWDYRRRAIYMITITLEDRTQEWLGHLLTENGEAQIAPTHFGEAALVALQEMPRLYPQVEILESQLMPEHIHFAVFVKERLPRPLGELIRGFKSGCTSRWRGSVPGPVPGPVPCHSWQGTPTPRWAPGFQDTVLLHEGQLQSMLNYIRSNPKRLAEKRQNPELFKRVTNLEVPLNGGRTIGNFFSLGNRHLLSLPLHQVQCSRRFFEYRRVDKAGGGKKILKDSSGEPAVKFAADEYQKQLEAAIEAAIRGAVILSPCISDGERQIAREILKQGFRLVALKNMGFSKYEKPSGKLFEACAEGRLLLLAPAAWPYSMQAKPMTRFDAIALNRIAQWLAGDGAAEINYRGMLPPNIDALALSAVMA